MKISVITATFNSEATLKETIQSVLEQDYKNIEYIIADGNSTDATLEIVKQYQTKNSNIHLHSEADVGIYDALNKGIDLATGEVIGFVHSDDLLSEPNILSKIMNCFESNRIDGVYGDLIYVDKNNSSKSIRSWESCDFDLKLLNKGWMPAHPTLFLKKEVYDKYGNFNLNYKIASDYDFMLRVLKDTTLQFKYLNTVITKMRMGGASNRNLKNVLLKSSEDYKILKDNNFSFPVITLFLKNISKIGQFF